jgi:hypothetical protein
MDQETPGQQTHEASRRDDAKNRQTPAAIATAPHPICPRQFAERQRQAKGWLIRLSVVA